MRKLLLALVILIVLAIAGVGAMFAFNLCPPQGPWPMPPWCKAGYSVNTYTPEDVQTAGVAVSALPQVRAVNMYDTWGRNYNMGMMETTQANIESSFDRVQKLGVQEVYVHDFDRAVYEGETDYTSTKYQFVDEIFGNDMRDESISSGDLKRLVDTAHARGMKLGIKRNLAFVNIGKFILSGLKGDISGDVQKDYAEFNKSHSEEWIRDYFAKWQARMIEKAKMYSEAGVDIMSMSPGFQDPRFAGHEALANELWKTLIAEVKKNFTGQVMVDFNVYGLIDGNNGAEDWKKFDYYKQADIVEVKVYKILEKYQSADKASMQKDIENMVKGLDTDAKNLDIKISIFFAPSSYVNGLYEGPVEYLDILNPTIAGLEKDYKVQADAYNYFFDALKNAQNITRVNVGNFTWDDALDPEVKPRVTVSASFRNKPAEGVVREWYTLK